MALGLESCLRGSTIAWVQTCGQRLLQAIIRGRSFTCLSYDLLSFFLLLAHRVSLLSTDQCASTMLISHLLISHLCCHHIFNILIGMKIVIDLILVEIDLDLIKLVKACNVWKLALRRPNHFFLFVGITITASWNVTNVVLMATKLTLWLRV